MPTFGLIRIRIYGPRSFSDHGTSTNVILVAMGFYLWYSLIVLIWDHKSWTGTIKRTHPRGLLLITWGIGAVRSQKILELIDLSLHIWAVYEISRHEKRLTNMSVLLTLLNPHVQTMAKAYKEHIWSHCWTGKLSKKH